MDVSVERIVQVILLSQNPTLLIFATTTIIVELLLMLHRSAQSWNIPMHEI